MTCFMTIPLMRDLRIRVAYRKKLAYTFHIADQQDIRQRAYQRHHGDINQRRAKAVILRQIANHQRDGDAAQAANKVKHPAGQAIRRIGAREETSDQVIDAKPLPKNASAISATDPDGVVGVVCPHDAGGDQQSTDDRRFCAPRPASSLFHQLIRQPTRQQDAKNAARKGTVVSKAGLQRGDAFSWVK